MGERKIASIGIAVRRWVSYHGFALNVRPALGDFELIHPCGLRGVRMTSMAELLGDRCPSWTQVLAGVAADVASALGYEALAGGVSPGLLDEPLWSDTALGAARPHATRSGGVAA